MNRDDPGRVWELASNQGWERFRCTVRGETVEAEQAAVVIDVLLSGQFWDRARPLEEGQLVTDHEVRLPQILASFSRLKALEKALREWLLLPLSELAVTPLASHEEIALSHQRLSLTFEGGAEDLIASGNPVVRIDFETGHLKGACEFVTDQSCVRFFADALGSYLRTHRSKPGSI